METRFLHKYQRDSSVSTLRLKMSRRRSQSQKENRHRAMNQRRHLDGLPELDVTAQDESAVDQRAGLRQQTGPARKQTGDQNSAIEERRRMLARYKEAKELQKEKERREKQKRGGVFKVGLYKPQPLGSLSQVLSVPGKTRAAVPAPVPAQCTRVTRSMKQQQFQKVPQKAEQLVSQKDAVSVPRKEQSAVLKAPTSRVKKPTAPSSGRGRAVALRSGDHSQDAPQPAVHNPVSAGPTTRAASKQHADGLRGKAKPEEGQTGAQTMGQKSGAPSSGAHLGSAEQPGASFAPQGFVFQAPAGLKPFQPTPLTPRSAEAFVTPRSAFQSPLLLSPVVPRTCTQPALLSPPPLRDVAVPQEAQHDVPYFRATMAMETERLTGLCEQWEARTEDASIPEDVRDGMRIAVGQARLLMKERFGQFAGLVDDCALGRGEKMTTCSDLQGFWDMVYYQVEDVMKKFDALKEAESRGWRAEAKPPPRAKRAVKKPAIAAATGLTAAETGASAAARSRLAAAKAAMKAKRAAGVDGVQDPAEGKPDTQAPLVVFHGGFFQVESPAKVPGPLRRSARLSVASSPHPSSKFTTPAKPRRADAAQLSPVHLASAAPSQTPHSSAQDPLSLPRPAHAGSCSPSGHISHEASLLNDHPAAQPPIFFHDHPESGLDQLSETPRQGCSLPPVLETAADLMMGGWCAVSTEVASPSCDHGTGCPEGSPPRGDGHAISFTLSPTPPAPSELSSSTTCAAPPGSLAADVNMCSTPDTSYVEYVTGPEFECYLRPALRSSHSPRRSVSMDTSPMAIDVDGDGPGSQGQGAAPSLLGEGQGLLSQLEVPGISRKPSAPAQTEAVGSGLLLYTPEQQKIRQSVCGRDLMMFTPPSGC